MTRWQTTQIPEGANARRRRGASCATRYSARCACSACRSCSAATAQDYPSRPVTIVVPFAPGGGADLMARLLAEQARAAARQELRGREQARRRLDHRGDLGAKSTPDGYTLLMAPAPTMAVNVSLYKNLPYDPTSRFHAARAAVGHALRADGQCRPAGEVGAGPASPTPRPIPASCRSPRPGPACRIICSWSCSRA